MLTKEEYLKEIDKLKFVTNKVNNKLNELGFKVQEDEENFKEFQKMMWQDFHSFDNADISSALEETTLEHAKNMQSFNYFKKLNKIKNKPYFASIIFEDEDGDKDNIYISMTYLKDENLDNILYDWRSPICSLYYDYEEGPCKYDSPSGEVFGNLLRKRQYKIENNNLVNVFDNSMNITDDYLQEVLNDSNNDKLKSIVNTIQKEQNKVIRDLTSNNLIVQGIAGSGKTTVALHRIAFLLYRLEDLKASNILIFSPNNIFSEYISTVLPSLGESNTKELTFHEYLAHFLKEYNDVEPYTTFLARYYKKEEDNAKLVEYKQSDRILKDLIKYIHEFEENAMFIKPIVLDKNEIDIDTLNNYLHYKYDNFPLFERLDEIATKLSETYYKGTEKKKAAFRKLISSSINFKEDYKEIYKDFFFSKYCKEKISEKEVDSFINRKVARYEDALLLTFIKGKLEGYKTDLLIKEVVVDEAQDYNILQYVILKNVFKKANFTILGDVNQNINPYYHYDTLEILNKLFKGETNYIELLKTYRSSPEIIDFSNKVLNLKHVNAIRNKTGKEVIVRKNVSNLKLSLEEDLAYLSNNYKEIAIITKDDIEAKKLYNLLNNKDITLLEEGSTRFNKSIVIVPAYLSKGLEFGGVIVYNDRINSYRKNERNLLYVGVTRAEHELIIYN